MKRLLISAAALVLGSLMISAAPANAQAAARHYDCSKAGNANKVACKGATPAPAVKPAPAPRPAPAARNYDCSKPGNANKAVCKDATPAPAPIAVATPKARNYDCSKAGNANKAVCKGATPAPAPAAPAPHAAPAPRAAPAPATHAPAVGQNTNPGGPNGATAKCRDNTYSFSAHRSGTCSRHGGVAQWY
ncbi:MAG: hypothetical protein JWR80_6159 [Bradyrhizobium sp.]|nr:hypothetical protein [Bradyrhizobium sp.]